jgi:Flp pilus assembly protein TadG
MKPIRMSSVLRLVRRFARENAGAAAVEFAMLLPVMMALYFGGVELTAGISASRKTTLVAHTVADLIAQTSNVTNADMTDIFTAAKTVATPFNDGNLSVRVSSIKIDNAGIAKIDWSDTLPGGTPRAVGSVVTLKPTLAVPNTSLIWSEIGYSYKPTFGSFAWVLKGPNGDGGAYNLHDEAMLRPRLSNYVTRSVN